MEGAEETEPVDGEVISLQDAINHVVAVPRIETGIVGIDYVVGNRTEGGFAQNGLYLLCGDPGGGKTTLLLQAFLGIAKRRYPALFITGEQEVKDVAVRAKNFGKFPGKMMIAKETDLDTILDIIEEHEPAIVGIDSAQTLFVDEDFEIGGGSTIKIAIRELKKIAKQRDVAVVIIGHITKGGAISGPRALEYFVDCNLYLSGRKNDNRRTLKCEFKNRYGETPRQAEFIMTEAGLVPAPEVDEEEQLESIGSANRTIQAEAPQATSTTEQLEKPKRKRKKAGTVAKED